MFGDQYVLIGQSPVREPNVLEWAEWMQIEGPMTRIVARTEIGASVVSTVFLGLDHAHEPPPLLFETMVFTDGEADLLRRCSTWLEAEAQHAEAVARVRATA